MKEAESPEKRLESKEEEKEQVPEPAAESEPKSKKSVKDEQVELL